MKLTAKAISSPARTDKFPPPLMRFLRSNAGSRSSRRSRSSPMFVLRKKNNTIETTQEPSSPKVTCMGQVRAKRSSKQSTGTPPRRCHCWWIRKPNPCRCRLSWPKWAFFRRKPTKLKQDDSVKSESNFQFHQDEEEDERVSVDDKNAFASSISCTPPKNALLLTRCRSAPYRSSSLASRFWGSPLRGEEEKETQQSTSVDDNDKPSSEKHSVSEQEDLLIRERIASENVEEFLKKDCEARPAVLTRCKSEPARTGERLDPEVNNNNKLWKNTRLGFAD